MLRSKDITVTGMGLIAEVEAMKTQPAEAQGTHDRR